MKKALVILLAIFMVGAAFAADVATPTLSGSVSATWGYNFQEKASGFKNDSDVVVTFPLAAFGNKAQGGEGMYGEIIVKDFGLKFNNDDGTNTVIEGDDYAVEGIIHFSSQVYAKVYSAPSIDYNFAENYKTDDGNTVQDINTSNDWIVANGGIELGYKSDMFTGAFRVLSKYDYDKSAGDTAVAGAKSPTDNLYMMQAALTLKPVEMLTLDAVYTMVPKDFETTGLGYNLINAKAAVAVGNLTFSVGSDMIITSEKTMPDATFFYDLAPMVSYKVVDGFTVSANAWTYGSNTSVTTDDPLNAKFVVEEAMDKGFVAPLSAKLTVALDDLLGDNANDDFKWYTDLDLGYKLVDGLKVSGSFGYGWDEILTAGGSLELGAAFHKIANTTFTLGYADFEVTKGDTTNKGTFTAVAKIAF